MDSLVSEHASEFKKSNTVISQYKPSQFVYLLLQQVSVDYSDEVTKVTGDCLDTSSQRSRFFLLSSQQWQTEWDFLMNLVVSCLKSTLKLVGMMELLDKYRDLQI